MDLNKKFKLEKIFWVVTLILILIALSSYNLPISGKVIFVVWLIAYLLMTFLMIDNKTSMQKDPKTGEWKEITIKKSAIEQATEIQRAEEEARKKHKLRQKNLSDRLKQKQIREQQKEKRKVDAGRIEGTGLMAKVKKLKKLYINGTLTKSEFEQAKDKLLK
tara:strand:+ start:96 stop:581 length:486 start_codon:yes stop_codon:yes gene_type:complete